MFGMVLSFIVYLGAADGRCRNVEIPFDGSVQQCMVYGQVEAVRWTAEHAGWELQRGYRFHERVIRPTMVKVGPPPEQSTQSATPADASSPLTDEAATDTTIIDAEATPTPEETGSAP